MFYRPTVLILGAGASIPYHYPSGPGLVKKITEAPETDDWRRQRREAGFSDEKFGSFKQRLALSHRTIDDFLQFNPLDRQLGKFIIAQRLLYVEQQSSIFQPVDGEGPWYDVLSRLVAPAPDAVEHNRLTIITFNYDRSLEHFLFESFKATFDGLDERDISMLVRKLNIIHVHGQLGLHPWHWDSGHKFPYGAEIPTEEVVKVAEGIEIIHESKEVDVKLRFVRTAMLQAEYRFFLGFDFHSENMKRLGLPYRDGEKPNGHFVGTSFKMTERRKVETKEPYGISLWSGGNIRTFMEEESNFFAATTPH